MDDYIWSIVALLPGLIIVAVYLACKGTKVKTDCPTSLKASFMDINSPDRKWGLK